MVNLELAACIKTKSVWLVGALVLATYSSVFAQDGARDDGPTFMGDIVIRIKNDTQPKDCIRKKIVVVGEKTGHLFSGNEGVEWSVAESLKNAKLDCGLSENRLTMGENGDEHVVVSYSREKLQEGKPGHVTVSIAKPEAIAPGFYQGQIKAWFKNEAKGVNHEGFWRVTVAVHGRILDSVRFDHEKSNALRVGETASLTAVIHAIGCDVGCGDLTVEFQRSGNKETALHIPIPLERSLDPRTALTGDKAIGSAHPKWADSVIGTTVSKVDDAFKDPEELHQAYEVKVQVPHLFELGNVVALVKWDQSQEAPSVANQSLKGERLVRVDGGIHVFPSLCSTNEPITIRAVSATDLGLSIKLIVKGPKNESFEANLSKATAGSDALGAHTEYVGKFRPPTTGRWEVTWPSADAQLAGAFGTPRTFEAWLEFGGDLAQPLTVFASATPVFWEVWGDPYQGSGWEETRKKALTIRFDEHFLKNVQFTPIGIFKVDESNGRFQRYDPAVEPTLTMVPNIEVVADSETPDSAADAESKKSETAKPPVANSSINVPLSGLTFNAVVKVARGNEEHPGNVPGDRMFYYRAILEGIGPQGQLVQKIMMVPVRITVTTDWLWYKTKIWWALAVIAFCGVLFFIYRTANPKLESTGPVESMIVSANSTNELGGFVGRSVPKPAAPAEQQKKDSKPEPEPEPEEEPVQEVEEKDNLTGFT